jgi:hypothetical protein
MLAKAVAIGGKKGKWFKVPLPGKATEPLKLLIFLLAPGGSSAGAEVFDTRQERTIGAFHDAQEAAC